MFDKNKIKVDKEFLDDILKKISDLENRLNFLYNNEIKNNNKMIDNDYAFICNGTQLTQDRIQAQINLDEFRNEIEPIAKKYKIVKFDGIFFKKI